MGRVTSATVIEADGSARDGFATAEAAAAASPAGQIELRYGYAPNLLPPGGDAATGTMWRYEPLLPLAPGPVAYPLAVGGTPMIAPPALRRALALPGLWLKDETRGPSGSNKDRATALVLELALRAGAGTVTCASTGNVAASVAIGAAAAGLRAVVFVPAAVAAGKLAPMLAAGAEVVKVRAGYAAAFRLSRQAAAAFGWIDRNTGVNPVTLEAKKTVAFEIWEQLGRRMPDAVVAPVGDGVTLHALGKGFRELAACGAAGRLPRVIGVQAAGCPPVQRAWQAGGQVAPLAGQTLADGIAVGAPVSGDAALREIRESGGACVAVADGDLLDAIALLARRAGVLAEPAGAAATAGVVRALAEGHLRPDETVVGLVTGTGLKTPEYLRPGGRSIEVEGRLDEVASALAG